MKAKQWLAANAPFLRALLFVAVYVSGALCLITLFLFGGFRLPSKILAAICLVSLALALASLGLASPG
jgi:hypothetical protein